MPKVDGSDLARGHAIYETDRRALTVLPSLLPKLLPGGEFRGAEYCPRNPTRQDRKPGSFKINLLTGGWAEFANHHEARGTGMVSLVQYVRGFSTTDEAVSLLTEAIKSAQLGELQRTFKPRPLGEPVVPIPPEIANLENVDFRSFACGLVPGHEPVEAFGYENETGGVAFFSLRYRNTETGAKTYRPAAYVQFSNGTRGWSSQRLTGPLPLYGQYDLITRRDAPVLVVEGERTAEAAAKFFPDHVVVTSANGSNAARQTDWSPLKHRDVTTWPDNDEPGAGYVADVNELAQSAGARSVRVVELPPSLPYHWDLADVLPQGLDPRALLDGALKGEDDSRSEDQDEDRQVGSTRPLIRLGPDNLKEVADLSEEALIANNRDLYQRGGLVVSVDTVKVITANADNVAARRIRERGDNTLIEDLSLAARYEKFDAKSKRWKTTEPPIRVVKVLKERGGRLRLPVLKGVITAPTLRADGSVLQAPGYDKPTGLVFDPCGKVFFDIRGAPSRKDAEGALAVLVGLIGSFPFVRDADKSVALAAIVTGVVRQALPTAPLFGFTAPVAGTGKSMLVDVASVIATGREAGVMAQGKTDEETEKRLASVLLAGDAVIAVDNCEAPLGGDLLCQMLTQGSVRIRILGRTETIELPTGALVTATGNNLILVGDMTRRALVCKLDPKEERPEMRRFDTKPVAVAKADRGTYVAAALTILRAYIIANRPPQVTPLGSFEVWSDTVRSALIWLGCADPVDTMEDARKREPGTIGLRAVMEQWRRVLRDRVAVGDVISTATRAGGTSVNTALQEALLTVAGDKGTINNVRLGRWLRKNVDRIVTLDDGAAFAFRDAGMRDGRQMWHLSESETAA